MTRRGFLQAAAAGPITLPEFQPKSMLHVAEHPLARAKFPVIDVHTHVFGLGGKMTPDSAGKQAQLKQIAQWMDECNLATLINLTGGTSETIPAIRKAIAAYGEKFLTAAEPVWSLCPCVIATMSQRSGCFSASGHLGLPSSQGST